MMRAGKNVDPAIIGRVPPCAWPGGYPIVCIVRTQNAFHRDEGCWCPECANEVAWEIPREESYPDTLVLIAYDAHYEGAPIECDRCGVEIESAYGDPDSEEEDES